MQKKYRNIVAERLKLLREMKDLSQAEAGKIMGHTNREQWSQWERKIHTPSIDTLVDICNRFEVPPKFFFTIDEEE